MAVELPDSFLVALADAIADRLAVPSTSAGGPQTHWMTTREAIAYSRIPAGTFRQLAAEGAIPSHGGRSKVFHRDEVDAAIRRYARHRSVTALRKAS